MKKLRLTFLIAAMGCFLSFSSLAQGFDFGIKAGVNIANQDISGDGISLDTKSLIGFHGGVFLGFMLSEKIGLQPEVLYSMQGSKIDFSGFESEIKMGYITIPILVRYNINDMISLHVGPQFGFLMSAEEKSDGDTQDIKDSFKGSDISGAFGVEVDLPSRLGFGARYVLGFSDIVESDGDFSGAEVKNGTFQIYVKFKLKSAE